MALLIDPAAPAAGDAVGDGDDQIRALKQALIDILGLPSATTIGAALFAATAAGLTKVKLQTLGADVSALGEIGRNGDTLQYHDGTTIRHLFYGSILRRTTEQTVVGLAPTFDD